MLALLLLTGCAAGRDAATTQIKQVTDGVEGEVGNIKIRNLMLVAQPNGSAVVVGTVLNTGATADGLAGITANGMAVTITATSLSLVQNVPIIFEGARATAIGKLDKLSAPAGSRVFATLTFTSGAKITLNLMIRESDGIFASDINGNAGH